MIWLSFGSGSIQQIWLRLRLDATDLALWLRLRLIQKNWLSSALVQAHVIDLAQAHLTDLAQGHWLRFIKLIC
jgi:hypothetical protein